MLDTFHISLEAKNPERDCFRAYRIEAGTDLFGTWVVEVTFGRIERQGRTIRFSTPDEQAAKQKVRSILRHRSTAVQRLGVPYLTQTRYDPVGRLLAVDSA